MVNARAELLRCRVEIIHTVAVGERGSHILHWVIIYAQVEHKYRFHRTECIENFTIFVIKMLSANGFFKEVLTCAAAYYDVGGDFLARGEANAFYLAVLYEDLINNSVINDRAAICGYVLRKSLGKLLTTTLDVAIAGVIFLAVFIKRYALIEGSLEVSEHHRKSLGLGRICAEVSQNSCIERSDLF